EVQLDHTIESGIIQSQADVSSLGLCLRTRAMPEQAQSIVRAQPAIGGRHAVDHRNARKRWDDKTGERARGRSREDGPVLRLALGDKDETRLLVLEWKAIQLEKTLDRVVVD